MWRAIAFACALLAVPARVAAERMACGYSEHAPQLPLRDCWGTHAETKLPADGAANVPRNALLLVLGGADPGYIDDGRRGPLLEGDRVHDIRADGHTFHFRTSNDLDRDAPMMPAVERLIFKSSYDEDWIELAARTTVETAYLEVTLVDDSGARLVKMLVPRGGLRAAAPKRCAGFELHLGARVCAHVRAVDLAGNASAPAQGCAEVDSMPGDRALVLYDGRLAYECAYAVRVRPAPAPPPPPALAERVAEVAFAWTCAFVLAGLAMSARRRRAHRAHARAAMVTPCSAEAVRLAAARTIAIDAVLLVLACTAIAVGFVQADDLVDAGWYTAPAVFVAALAGLDAVRARRCLRVLRDDEVSATRTAGCAFLTRHGWLLGWQRLPGAIDPIGVPAVRIVRVR